jgi:DNA-binding MarR family transcriptional regulator
MNSSWKPGDPVPHVHDDVPDALAELGFSPAAVTALLDFDTANFQHYRMVVKGELISAIIGTYGLDMELAHFQALTAIIRIRCGVGRVPRDPTIGLVAEEMAIDPSRASRIVADLVAKTYVRREAAQDDGRKSVLSLTPEGKKLMETFRREKWKIMARVFQGWTAEDIAAFARSVRTYAEGMQQAVAEVRARRRK